MSRLSPHIEPTLLTSVPGWRSLVGMADEELATHDPAAVNLACAAGLPDAEQIDSAYCFATLDRWASEVSGFTTRVMPQYYHNPHKFGYSEAYFRTLCLITVLQRDCGVRYNENKVPEDASFGTADSFIHGVIQGDGGTCATLPVVYAAVGRRLGYPIKLVYTLAKRCGHTFARWEEPRERFNIEASNIGLSTPSDDYYRHDAVHGLYELPPDAERLGQCLVTATPRMELASFIATRAWCWHDKRDWRQCTEAWAWACSLAPSNELMQESLKRALNEWTREQRPRKPLAFPSLWVETASRAYPALALEIERDIRGLCAVQNMLDDPRLDERLWSRMRRGDCDRIPKEAVANFTSDGNCTIGIRFE